MKDILNKYKRLIFIGIFFVNVPQISFTQIKFICPLPNALIQKAADSAYLKIQCTSNHLKKVRVTIADTAGKEIAGLDSKDLTFLNNSIDTFFVIPLLRKFTVKWRSFEGQIDSG